MWHSKSAVDSFTYTFLHAGIHSKKSLVWFQVPGLCYIMDPHWDSSWASHCCPWSAGHHPPPVLQQITYGVEVRVGQFNPISGPGPLQGWSAHQFSLVYSTRESFPVLSWLVHPLQHPARGSQRLSLFSGFHVLKAGSSTPTLSRPALLCCPGEGATLLSATAVKGKEHVPILNKQSSIFLWKVISSTFLTTVFPFSVFWGVSVALRLRGNRVLCGRKL